MEENRQNNYGSSKIEFTARITGPDGQVVEKTVSTMGDIPSLEDFDLSTMEGFLSDFDVLEKAILEARNKIGKEMAAEYLEQVSKKKRSETQSLRTVSAESELGRFRLRPCGDLAMTLKPKEQIYTLGFLYAAARVCTRLSYREATDTINLFLHRDSMDSVKLRTLSDRINHIGAEISQELSTVTMHTLEMYGFDKKTGIPHTDTELSDNIIGKSPDQGKNEDLEQIQSAIDDINAAREEKIPLSADEALAEKDLSKCIYISIDDIGVKRQKDKRGEETKRKSRFVENTVAHIQHEGSSYTLTAIGMEELFKTILAFLLINNLLKYELIFFTDGARNIKNCIEKYFSFHPSYTILDWFHLQKKCKELLSMAINGKEKRNMVLEKLLRYLWVGDVDGSEMYLKSLTKPYIKNQGCLEDVSAYLERKRTGITCYAVRKKLGLRISSNPVEKANDLLVARRQKHNGMSWTPHGSGALAAIEMLYENGQADSWFKNKQLSFLMPDEKICA